MKKVLSVAMASAMVLGMGANAFAIKYNVDSNDKAKWPTNFKFDGELFVTDKNGDLVKDATTNIRRNSKVDFQPGDVVWMPLYADDQERWDAPTTDKVEGYEGAHDVRLENKDYSVIGSSNKQAIVKLPVEVDYAGRKMVVAEKSARYFFDGKEYRNEAAFIEALNKELPGNTDGDRKVLDKAYITVDLKGVKDVEATVNGPVVDEHGKREYGLYTGNIDKNWSINLIESKGSTVTDFVEKAELYKADEYDYASYKNHVDIQPNAVYVRVQLKKEWKTCDTTNVKYHVYVADNAGNATNKVYVEGKYAAAKAKTVDFTWSNDASVASLWKAEENGVAVFDFKDKAFFTVKMYKGECLYLDLDAAYKLATAREFDGEIDSFYYFDKENANFFREGELVIVSDNDELNVYEVTEDGAEMVEADYVKGHAVAHTNQKVNGYVFNTKELGNYVLAEGVEEEEVAEEEEAEEAEEVEEEEEAPAKVNPDTGANDFVGLAVSLAVVSVAAAGALALKK